MTTDKWGTPQLGLTLPRVLLVSPIFSSAIDIGRCYFYRPHRESNNVTSWQASEMRREKGVGHPIPLPTLFGLANPGEMPSLNRLMGHLTPTEFIVSKNAAYKHLLEISHTHTVDNLTSRIFNPNRPGSHPIPWIISHKLQRNYI